MSDQLPAGLAILGPTASGKSALAMELARQLPVEIISVDSAQVYRGLDIGTAKPPAGDRRAVVHHLIDIREPGQVYSAGEFRDDALRLVREIAARGRIPLLVGGTMLYFRAFFRGIAELPTADPGLRAEIDRRAAREGWPALHAELAARDPAAAARIHPHDAQRIQRALEVLALAGRPLTSLWVQEDSYRFDEWTVCIMEPSDRRRLHELIGQRLEQMVAAGFVDEVRGLLARPGLTERSPALRLVGYRQLAGYVAGRDSLQGALEKARAATRQLAKRQLTWLRGRNLLPSGAKVIRTDPFDETSRLRTLRALGQGKARA